MQNSVETQIHCKSDAREFSGKPSVLTTMLIFQTKGKTQSHCRPETTTEKQG